MDIREILAFIALFMIFLILGAALILCIIFDTNKYKKEIKRLNDLTEVAVREKVEIEKLNMDLKKQNHNLRLKCDFLQYELLKSADYVLNVIHK